MKKYSTQDLWIRVVLFFAICVILIFTFQGFALRLVRNLFNNGNRYPETLEVNIVRTMNGIVGIGLVYIFLKFDRQKMSAAGFAWNKEFGWEWILISIPIAIAGLLPTIIIEWSFGIIFIPTEMVEHPELLIDPIRIIITFFVTMFAISLGEEILFRGYIQTILETKYSFIFAAIVSAGLFGMLHLLLLAPSAGTEGQLESMIAILFSAFAMGLTFSYVFKNTKHNLIFPVAIHGFWDFFIFVPQAEFAYANYFYSFIEICASIIGATVIFLLIFLYSTKRLANAMVANDNEYPTE